MKAFEFMEKLKKNELIIRNKQAELDMLHNSFMVSNPTKKRLENELKEEIASLIRIRKEMLTTIERLPEPEYAVLHGLYVQRLTLQELADSAGKSYSWAAQRKGKALKMIQKIIDET